MPVLPPSAAAAEFTANVARVEALMNFDRIVLDFVTKSVEGYIKRTEEAFKRWVTKDDEASIHQSLKAEGLRANLRSIRDNRSLTRAYTEVNNQALVLLVSYFTSAVRGLVRAAIIRAVVTGSEGLVLAEELRVTVAEISDPEASIPTLVAHRLLEGKGVSFQDMKSIARTLERFTGYCPPRTATVNDIIVGQAMRHAIVHAGATVDEAVIRQLRDASPRSLKHEVTVGQPIEFEQREVMIVANAMATYLGEIASDLEARAM